ncbi:conserved domain protein [Paenibacillus sp. HGF5]|nr:conserved domain protein [Paenibacillus sp. HGF5]
MNFIMSFCHQVEQHDHTDHNKSAKSHFFRLDHPSFAPLFEKIIRNIR